MIQHVVLLTFVPEATAEQRAAVTDGLRTLPGLIPETQADYEAYRDDPAHRQVINHHIAPIRAERAAIQFER